MVLLRLNQTSITNYTKLCGNATYTGECDVNLGCVICVYNYIFWWDFVCNI